MTPAEMLQYINDNYDDYSKCVEVLMRDGMDEEAAHEHVAFNVLDAWAAQDGENMPVFVHNWRRARGSPGRGRRALAEVEGLREQVLEERQKPKRGQE